MSQINIKYFALLKEEAGVAEEIYRGTEILDMTLIEMYQQLKRKHNFTLRPESLRVAVNLEFTDWNYKISQGDSIAFIPPVSGG